MRARDVGRRRWDVPETQNRLGPLSLSFEVGQTQRTHCPRTRVPLNTTGTDRLVHSGGGPRRATTSGRLGIQQDSAMRKVQMRSSRDPVRTVPFDRGSCSLVVARVLLSRHVLARPFDGRGSFRSSPPVLKGLRNAECGPVADRRARDLQTALSRSQSRRICEEVADRTGLPPTLSSVWLTRLCVETSARPPAVHRRSFVLVRVGLARSCCSPSRLQPS